MRVLVTGAGGFVGRWLTSELEQAGHQVVPYAPGRDVRDADALRSAIVDARPDAVAHLAAVAFAPDAAAAAASAFEVAVMGTINVIEAIRQQVQPPALLVSGSSEVYGTPAPDELPLTEAAPLRPSTPYALSKAAQEAVALAYAARHSLPVVVTRSFNHAGPGQRHEFVVPALARRALDVARGRAADLPVGNLDVRRDLADVRDVARAYRLLLEWALANRAIAAGIVVNVCSGRSVSIRQLVGELCRLAGVDPTLRVDPELVRPNEAPEIRGDHAQLSQLTGWQPAWTVGQTLASVWREVAATEPASPRAAAAG